MKANQLDATADDDISHLKSGEEPTKDVQLEFEEVTKRDGPPAKRFNLVVFVFCMVLGSAQSGYSIGSAN